MNTSPFHRVAIVGLGVMGGSLAKALAALDAPPRRVGWSPSEKEGEAAVSDGALDQVGASVEDTVTGADLVVLAAPLSACIELVPRVHGAMAPEAVLTDVASLKAPMQAAAARAQAMHRWVGSHPMCGAADSGYAAARADLYGQAQVWVVASPGSDAPAARVSDFWRSLGARPANLAADAHDALMALISHTPQLAANALARVFEERGTPAQALGTGGMDMTRLAASSPDMWRDILRHASPALPDTLRRLAGNVESLADMVEAGDEVGIAEWMERTRKWRRSQ